MIVLGWSEPHAGLSREVRKTEVDIDSLLDAETEAVVVEVPSASAMITIDNAPNRVRKAVLYYECATQDVKEGGELVEVRLYGVPVGSKTPESARGLGHFWVGGSLVAVYGVVQR